MIREVGNPNKSHKYTVQCVLPINLFNKQIFVFIWLWYIILLVLNIINFLIWIQRCFPCKANRWIKQRVSLEYSIEGEDEKIKLKNFIEIYLEPDGNDFLQVAGLSAVYCTDNVLMKFLMLLFLC